MGAAPSRACHAVLTAFRARDHIFHLNYAITLFNHGEHARAREQFDAFEELFKVRCRERGGPRAHA